MRKVILYIIIYIPIQLYSQELPPLDFNYNRIDSAVCNNQIQRISFLNESDTTEYYVEYDYSYSNNKQTKITTGFLKSGIPIGEYKIIDSCDNMIYYLDFDTLTIGYQELQKIALENDIDLNSRNIYFSHKTEFNFPNEGKWIIPINNQHFTHYSEHEELYIDALTGKTETSSYTIMFQVVLSEIEYTEPRFVGGDEGLKKYLNEKSVYPISETGDKWVNVLFEIDKTGNTQNITVNCTRSTNHNKEAIRLVESMPHWIPAQDKNGKNIDINWDLKIMFD